ncbi:hypothetical protein A5740_22725 [Mycobacterium sp. GA-1841]|uniref:hypothetical protein n=1 Tax=Mycobacterium sp. GA-1841 TaxID=1834154 RepID=UPI00096DA6A4|nr:hypothetical protein [Mycobacterium sp. GA-1841]OMC41287.1 hypothetical protein A5740_22725 [Mycobacterium sp. GA-1841]
MWDDEVDVVCCGSGFGALAVAVAAADAGADVYLARSPIPSRPRAAADGPWLGVGIDDPETREYFDELSADLSPATEAECDTTLTVRPVSDWTPVSGRGRIAPFYGARLQVWAQQCLTSPYGVLYTRLADRGTTSMKTRDGEEIQVKVLGAVEADSGTDPASAVGAWLSAQVHDRQIEVSENSTLQRIVFEEDEIVGVVLDTSEGPLALRTRHGIAVSTEPLGGGSNSASQLIEADKPLQVALVGYNASRFGRVEVLERERDGGQSAYCGSGGVRESGRDAGRSHPRRRREMHRYPPFG